MTFPRRVVQKFQNSRRAVQKLQKIEARCSKNAKNRGAQFKAKKYPKAIYWSEFATLFLLYQQSCTESLREMSLKRQMKTRENRRDNK
jgi:hypothetical protein